MDSVEEAAKASFDAVKDTLVDSIDGLQLRKDAPWSPEISDDLAASMPKIHGRFPLTLPWSKAKPVDPAEDSVWIFDNTAFRTDGGKTDAVTSVTAAAAQTKAQAASASPSGHRAIGEKPLAEAAWQVEYVAAYFAQRETADNSAVLEYICQKTGTIKGDSAEETIKKRIKPFIAPILPRHTIRVNIGNVEQQTLGPSSSSGISSSVNALHFAPAPAARIVTTAVDASSESWVLACDTVFSEPTGWGLISDIDDTIKITQTPSAIGILKTTFVEDPRPVAGMPELYSHIQKALDPSFFYLSASPYNLYPFLRDFRKQHYPDGTIILRDASWQNLAGLISSLRINVQEYKVDRITKIHSWFPERTFICVGDSTQKDPESYGEAARRFPGWIKAIFIRRVENVSDVTDVNQHEKNAPERFQKAFEGLDSGIWHVFDEPAEVQEKISQLVK
ncbi:hypothetical protein MBLNU459_g4212t1 [Dothideomycetes sp. NU459]